MGSPTCWLFVKLQLEPGFAGQTGSAILGVRKGLAGQSLLVRGGDGAALFPFFGAFPPMALPSPPPCLAYRNPAAEVGVTELRKHRGREMLTAMIYFLGWMWGIDPSGIIADARERARHRFPRERRTCPYD